ncbi:Predicted methyltransferase [Phaffia rhodozyma]|uniref:Predicted methyltransferase n=1 Tax=Phaffia rhodozyma TaxID=264483 RepID=A0A0F7SQS4_PHARH|nr:Predicted methyltransferase [Phaffia rhodozyma]
MSSDSEQDGLDLDGIFVEPPRPASPPPTFSTYSPPEPLQTGPSSISIRLVGSHPLWGQHLWNSARVFTSFVVENAEEFIQGRNVLELGAAGALPGVVAALSGAKKTVITDYPDKALMDNISFNVEANVPLPFRENVHVLGHTWGTEVDSLLACLPEGEKFDTLILSDLVFNHTQHKALLKSCAQTSSLTSRLLVFYTHHRPHFADRDLVFFDLAREDGWECEEIVTEWTGPMFETDPGDEKVRGTVHGWVCKRSSQDS